MDPARIAALSLLSVKSTEYSVLGAYYIMGQELWLERLGASHASPRIPRYIGSCLLVGTLAEVAPQVVTSDPSPTSYLAGMAIPAVVRRMIRRTLHIWRPSRLGATSPTHGIDGEHLGRKDQLFFSSREIQAKIKNKWILLKRCTGHDRSD